MQPKLQVELTYTQRRLPWIVGAAALVIYLVTLNYSATIAGIMSLAKAAGWDWRSNVIAPLHVILTFPVRWLPASWQLTALNLTAAGCAALALALLARSVALLPHDRTRGQRAVERSDFSLLSIRSAWLPPVLAAAICGLQLTFWENAVVATGEALDLLIFAWLVHSLLQYRLDQKEARLARFAFVYGLAITNNFGMIPFALPFVVAILWIKGLAFFNWRFLLRMVGCTLTGLLLYLLLPLLSTVHDPLGFGFWELLKGYWGFQKQSVLGLPRYVVLLSSFTSLLPVLFIGIRWPAQFGEVSPIGNTITNLMTHVIHAVFLLACIYVAFDPSFSPRNLSGELYALLPLYFLGALTVGYCSGYLLLVFGAKPGPQAWQRRSPIQQAINFTLQATVWAAAAAAPAALMVKNFPTVRANTGKEMSRLSELAAKSLPNSGVILLSDDVFQLYSLHYELLLRAPGHKHLLVDTTSLAAPAYHRFLHEKNPQIWPKLPKEPNPHALIYQAKLAQLITELGRSTPLYYLHPSFGYYFERFYTKPHQLVYELTPYPTNSLSAPVLTAAELKAQDAYWRSIQESNLAPLIKAAQPFTKQAKNKRQARTLRHYVSETYSKALNHFGVEAQKAGDFATAGTYFDWAVQINPVNPAAFVNQGFNRQWRETKRFSDKPTQGITERLESYGGRWDAILGQNGPPDEPNFCYILANVLERGNNFRQAGQALERTIAFDPENRSAHLAHLFMCVKAGFPSLASEGIAGFRSRFGPSGIKDEEEMELIRGEAWAAVGRNELAAAETLLTAAQQKYPKNSTPWETLVDIYLEAGQPQNAINVLERMLKLQPDSVRALVNYGALKSRMKDYPEALRYLDRALQLDPRDVAGLINRAITNLSLDRLDDAQRDYEMLNSIGAGPHKIAVIWGLAETYFRKKNRAQSLKYYKEFVKAVPAGMAETQQARERIKLLESGAKL